jgi:D-alanine-D-alanine ligase
MGGKSIEREVSLNSGRTVCDHLDTLRYLVVPVFQTAQGHLYILPGHFVHRGKISDFERRLEREAQRTSWDELKTLIDFAYIALHGRYGEDGIVQGFLELLGIPYLGSKVLASALGMDKVIQKDFLRAAGVLVPRDIVVAEWQVAIAVRDPDSALLCERLRDNKIDFPVIVKPSGEGSSLGVSKVHETGQLAKAVKRAAGATTGKTQSVLVEECIEGLEFSCIVITDRESGDFMALPPTEIVVEDARTIFEYDQKYMPGRATKYTPARCSHDALEDIKRTSLAVMRALGLTNIGRVDGFLTPDNQIVIVDPNSLSGMGPASHVFLQAAEIDMTHTDIINHLIETELCQYGVNDGNDAIVQHQEAYTGEGHTRIRVGVLLGGTSNEKEISLESGRNVCYKLSPHKYQVQALFLNKNHELYAINQRLLVRNTTQEIEHDLEPSMHVLWEKLSEQFDFIFIGLHGAPGENGDVQGALEMLGLPYNGSPVLPSALCIDKYKTNNFLRTKGFDVPDNLLVSVEDWKAKKIFGSPFGYPVIIKPHDDGCSFMVQKAQNDQEFMQALEVLFAAHKSSALIEECIIGTELTIGVLGNDAPCALPPSEAIATKGILSIEEKFLPGAGENQTPANISASAQLLAQQTIELAYAALGCKGYARIDCFYQSASQSKTGHDRVVILEVNTLPGLTPATCFFHQAAEVGIKPMDLVDLIVQLGFEYHTQKPHLTSAQRTLIKSPDCSTGTVG